MNMRPSLPRSRRHARHGRHAPRILCLALLTLLLCATAAIAAQLPSMPQAAAGGRADWVPSRLTVPQLPLLPYLRVYIDTTGEMDVEEVAALPESSFAPLDVRHLPHVTGVTWLRFVLEAATPGNDNSAILLDMGESVPGLPVLFSPLFNAYSGAVEWQETPSSSRNVLLLPKAGAESQVCFLRLDGLPGLWFSPTLRTPHNAATDLSGLASKSALLALGVVMLLCLLRGLSEHGQWRIWTALYVAAALVQGYCGIPGNGAGHFSLEDAASLLTPGLALMFLPHVGRHLMRTRGRHRILDVQFILLVLPGAVLALLPMLPGMGWVARFLPLWPVCTLLLVPTATGACLMGLPGARRFLLGLLLPPLAAAAAVLGLNSDYSPSILASLPLWGTALSALVIAATAVPRQEQEEDDEEEAPIDLTMPAIQQGTLLADDAPLSMARETATGMLPVFDDPNLRLLPTEEPGIALPNMEETPVQPQADAPAPTAHTESRPPLPDARQLEEALRRPLDDLMRESAALEQFSLPPSVRQTAQNMAGAARQMLSVLRDPAGALPDVAAPSLQEAFDLQELMRSVHDSVAAAAENAGIALSWYMPPHLPPFYSGELQALDAVLRELLESAVRATRQGAVHFSVRHVPDSEEPGHLLFTVQDSGSGTPPAERSSLALSHAWELAGRHNGFLSAECGIRGATIAFTLHLEPIDGGDDMPAQPDRTGGHKRRRARILVCTPGAMDRQALVHMLDGLSCVVLQARTLPEALALHEQRPVTMLLLSGAQVSADAQDTLERFRQCATAARLPVFGAIAVTGDDSGWDALAQAGFTHALLEPVDRQALRQTVQEILDAFFGSQDTPEESTRTALSRPAGFPPLPDLPGMRRERAERPAPSDGEAPASQGARPQEMPPAAESGPAASPAATIAAEPPAAAVVDEDKPCIDNQWGVTRVTSADLPPIDNQWGVDAPRVEELPAIDNQWGARPAAAPDRREMDGNARDAGTEASPSPESVASEPVEPADTDEAGGADKPDQRVSLHNEWGVTAAAATPSPVADRQVAAAPAAPVAADSPSATGGLAALEEDSRTPDRTDAPCAAAQPCQEETAEPDEPAAAPAPQAAGQPECPATPVVPDTAEEGAAPAATVRPQESRTAAARGGEQAVEWVGEPVPVPRAAGAAPEKPRPEPKTVAGGAEGADAPQVLTLREALQASEREEGRRTPSLSLNSPTAAASAPRAEDSGGTPSFLRRVLDRLQGESRRQGAAAAKNRTPDASAATTADSLSLPDVGEPMPIPRTTPVTPRPEASVAAPNPVSPRVAAPVPPVAPVSPTERVDGAMPLPSESAGSEVAPDQEMLELVARFERAVRRAQEAFANGHSAGVADAAEAIARDADAFGFRSLGRMARCVQQAGRHEDLGALRDLLPDLVMQVERNRLAIQKELR